MKTLTIQIINLPEGVDKVTQDAFAEAGHPELLTDTLVIDYEVMCKVEGGLDTIIETMANGVSMYCVEKEETGK
jgi:hypothetical protein